MVIDFHTHILPPWSCDQRQRYLEVDATFGELFADPKLKLATAEDLVEAMDEDGVDTSVVLGFGWTDRGLAREVNDYIIDSVNRYPGRIVGFAGVNPAWGDDAVHEVDRCAGAGVRGIGELHPDSQAFDLGDQATMAPLVEALQRHRLILTTHSSEPVGHLYPGKGTTGPDVLWRFVQNFPQQTLVCAHWGGGLPFYALMPEVGEGIRNVYFDTATSPYLYTSQIFSAVAGLVGPERILLGSDYPLLRSRRLLQQVGEVGLSQEAQQAVISGNARSLLGI